MKGMINIDADGESYDCAWDSDHEHDDATWYLLMVTVTNEVMKIK